MSRREAFANLYRTIDREIPLKQGRIHLCQRADTLVERVHRLVMILLVTGLICVVIAYLAFIAWFIVLAYQIGVTFSSLHNSAFSALLLND